MHDVYNREAIILDPRLNLTWKWLLTILFFGLGVSVLGDQIYLVALNVWLLSRTHSSLVVAGLWMLGPTAGLIFGTFVGGLADRRDRRNTLIIANGIGAIAIGVIPFFHQVLWIYIAGLIAEGAQGLFAAAFRSYYMLLVPQNFWSQANSIRGGLSYGGMVLGPAIAGVFLAWGYPQQAIWLDALTFVFASLTLLVLPRLNPHNSLDVSDRHSPYKWRDDLRMVGAFIKKEQRLRPIMIGFYGMVIFALAAGSQEVVFLRNVMDLSERTYAYVVSMSGVGYIIGVLVSLFVSRHIRPLLLLAISTIPSAVCYVIFSQSHTVIEAIGTLIGVNLFQAISNVTFTGIIQRTIPMQQIGRIISTIMAMVNGATLVTIFAGGLVAAQMGARFLMTVATLSALASTVWLGWACLRPWAIDEASRPFLDQQLHTHRRL